MKKKMEEKLNSIPKQNQEKTCVKRGAGYYDFPIILTLLVIFAFFTFGATRDTVSITVNFAVLAVMLLFLLVGMGRLWAKIGSKQLRDLTEDFNNLQELLEDLDQKNPGMGWSMLREQKDIVFKNKLLEQSLSKMNAEMDVLSDGADDSYQCDISEYVNEDLLDTVGNAHFNDFVSNVMTGLGILGTFIGLAIGLRSFDASSAEEMTNSIVPLIDGIKVAFYTSIFGVTFSLVYGTLYRINMAEAENALKGFLDTYRRCQGSKPDNAAISKFLSYQREQTDSMREFAENISIALADAMGNVFNPVFEKLPDQISQAMNNELAPTLKGLEASMDTMASELTTKIVDAQSEGVSGLVDQFMSQMDSMMHGQIENLGKSIETICTWQKETVEYLNSIVAEIGKNAVDVSQMTEKLEKTGIKLEKFLSDFEQVQEKNNENSIAAAKTLAAAAASVELLGTEMKEISGQCEEAMRHIGQVSEQTMEQVKGMHQLVDVQIEKLQKSSEMLEKQSLDMGDICETVSNKFTKASTQMLSAADGLNEKWDAVMAKSFKQFDSELAKALLHFSGTLSELRDVAEGTPQIIESTLTQLKNQTNTAMRDMEKYQQQFGRTVEESLRNMSREIGKMKMAQMQTHGDPQKQGHEATQKQTK